MNYTLKNFILLLSIALVITLPSCKPDAVIANYSCTEHYYIWKAPNYVYDSIVGFAPVMVYKSSSDGMTLIINQKTNGVYSEKYSNSRQNAYITDYAANGEPQIAYFISGSDSIWMQTQLVCDNGSRTYHYFTGHRE